ncbi:MAG TPA: dTMP kinase [Terriglobales bacterium]|nr:dTMP kinase [Terriglobales bacterium]
MTAAAHGKFITFEGLDGCGKSTQLEKLAAYLRGRKLDVLSTREPGGTPLGDRIRAILLDSHTASLDAHAELALMFASRAQHVYQVILPAIHAGKIVLCDRFTDSSEAYQGGGRELGSEPVLALHRVLCAGLQPDLTILLDSGVAASVARARRRNLAESREKAGAQTARGKAVHEKAAHGKAAQGKAVQEQKPGDENRFERESQAFFERVHRTFHEIARREPERVIVIDSRRSIEVVHGDIVKAVEKRLGLSAKKS